MQHKNSDIIDSYNIFMWLLKSNYSKYFNQDRGHFTICPQNRGINYIFEFMHLIIEVK